LTQILELLSDVAASRSNFSVKVEDTEGGGKTTTVTPSISAFSDHMVISFDAAELQENDLDTFFALSLMRTTAGRLAHRARELKCLIRGAITLGPLYHGGGVIFGDGLVKAHTPDDAAGRQLDAPGSEPSPNSPQAVS
jgi:hypothetical protein